MIPTEIAGYYDRFTPGETDWKGILFRPGVALQAAELNEIQSMLRDEIEQFGQTIYETSAPIEGLEAVVDLAALKVTITSGKLYALGMIHRVAGAEVTITGVGTELIGVTLTPSLVTAAEEPTLMDPAVGAENYGYEGANRMVYTAAIVKIVPGINAYPIAEIVDGQLSNNYGHMRPLWSKFIAFIEKRTYEESGHYLLHRPRVTVIDDGPEHLLFRANDLQGYVDGRRVGIENVAARSGTTLDTMTVLDELQLFSSGTLKYQSYNAPIREVSQLTGRVYAEVSMTRGAVINGSDAVPGQYWPVAQVLEVRQGGTVYTSSTDYVVSGNNINWSLGGAEPATGSTYVVKLLYMYQFVKEIRVYSGSGSKSNLANWTVSQSGDYLARDSFKAGSAIEFYDTPKTIDGTEPIDFKTEYLFTTGGVKPHHNTEVQLDYKFALPNYYIMAVDKRGILYISQGVAAANPTLPNFGPSFLPFVRFKLPPEARASDVETTHLDVVRLSMIELQKMLRQVRDLQYNQTQFQLHYELTIRETPTDKRAVFADDFSDFIPSDYTRANYNASLNLPEKACYLGLEIEDVSPVVTSSNATSINDSWFIPYTHKEYVAQRFSNHFIQVNAYDYVSLGAIVVLDPPEDVFLATEYIVYDNITERHLEFQLPDRLVNVQGPNINLNSGNVIRDIGRRTTVETNDRIVNSTVSLDLLSSQTEETVTLYSNARQININVDGREFLPNEEIIIYFSGKAVFATPAVGFNVGVEAGSVICNASGQLKCSFVVPEGQRNDIHKVSFVGNGGALGASAGSYAEVTYLSDARLSTICTTNNYLRTRTDIRETTVTTTTQNLITWGWQSIDPVAQTFTVDEDVALSRVHLFFRQAGNTPVQLLIVTTENGIPTSQVLGECVVNSANIIASMDASAATIFEFTQPVYLHKDTEYAMVVKTDNANAQLWVSQFGAASGLLKNPHTGVLLRSANARTWSPEQLMDMKFVLDVANFSTTTSEVVLAFNLSSPRAFFALAGTNIQPSEKTLVRYQYNTGGAGNWLDFKLGEDVAIGHLTNTINVRVTLMGVSNNSPIVNNDLRLRAWCYALTGDYEAREFIVETADVRYVDLWLDEIKPSGTTIVPKLSFDGGITWTDMVDQPADLRTLDAATNEVERHYLYDTGSDATLKTAIKIRVAMSTASAVVSPRLRKLRAAARTI